jgi:hypothetical protein
VADDKKPKFTDYERYLLDVEQRNVMADIYPDGTEAQWLRERARLAEVNPNGPEARQIQEEARLAKRYAEEELRQAQFAKQEEAETWRVHEAAVLKEWEARNLQEQIKNKEGLTDVTPEQQTRVDQALSDTSMSKIISGPSDAGANPTPKDPTPMEQAKDIGQDLRNKELIVDK